MESDDDDFAMKENQALEQVGIFQMALLDENFPLIEHIEIIAEIVEQLDEGDFDLTDIFVDRLKLIMNYPELHTKHHFLFSILKRLIENEKVLPIVTGNDLKASVESVLELLHLNTRTHEHFVDVSDEYAYGLLSLLEAVARLDAKKYQSILIHFSKGISKAAETLKFVSPFRIAAYCSSVPVTRQIFADDGIMDSAVNALALSAPFQKAATKLLRRHIQRNYNDLGELEESLKVKIFEFINGEEEQQIVALKLLEMIAFNSALLSQWLDPITLKRLYCLCINGSMSIKTAYIKFISAATVKSQPLIILLMETFERLDFIVDLLESDNLRIIQNALFFLVSFNNQMTYKPEVLKFRRKLASVPGIEDLLLDLKDDCSLSECAEMLLDGLNCLHIGE